MWCCSPRKVSTEMIVDTSLRQIEKERERGNEKDREEEVYSEQFPEKEQHQERVHALNWRSIHVIYVFYSLVPLQHVRSTAL